VFRQFTARFGQLFVLQVLGRGVFAALAVLGRILELPTPLLVLFNLAMLIAWFFVYSFWPYSNEILLLERNPLFKSAGQDVSTLSRTGSMHGFAAGELFVRWMTAIGVALTLTVAVWLAMLSVRGMLTTRLEFDRTSWMVLLPAAAWIVSGYLAVDRFLAYLDLRIRSEGWEVELLMRAEGARLERHLA
jgi:hypothetical protein